jgi:hypothetical protein
MQWVISVVTGDAGDPRGVELEKIPAGVALFVRL